jgi:predicted glutamine amidotransferase
MCGLVGVAGNLETKDETLMKRLLWFDYWRGMDSTGLAAVNLKGEAAIAKIHSHPSHLFDMAEFKKVLNGSGSLVFLGHNRAATRGKVNYHNTHPFQFDHIVGAHNGTLEHWCQQKLQKMLDQEFEVDSEAIIAAIAKFGIKKTIPLLRGAWSLTFVDLKQGSLNFIRNDERPMWYAFIENKDGVINKIVWASEWWMIDSAMKGYIGGELWENEKGNSFFETTADTLFSFDISALNKGSKSRPKPKATVLKGDERPLGASGSNGYGWSGTSSTYSPWFDDNDNWDHDPNNVLPFMPRTSAGRPTSSTIPSPSGFNPQKKREPIHLDGSVSEPFAGRISRERFEELTRSYRGCCWCGNEIEWEGAAGISIFEQDDKILCSDCSTSGYTGTNRIYVR